MDSSAWIIIWLALGVVGSVLILLKGYGAGLADWGCITWILFGWWGLLIIPGLGPITLLLGLLLPSKKRCPFCRSLISGAATRCPHCQGDLQGRVGPQ